MTEQNGFKRLNYFTGLFTTADDWEEEQAYHRQKLRLHYRWAHATPGIVRFAGDELRVEAAGGLKVRILPGAALDGLGREIYLVNSRELNLSKELGPGQGKSSRTVYIVAEYAEEKTEYVENLEQPQYSGHTRITERPRLGATSDEPDNQARLELARIELEADATEVADADDPDHPQVNQIDRRHVRWSASVARQEEQLSSVEARLVEEEAKSARFEDRLNGLDQVDLLHNRGLHTPGIIRAERDGLQVVAAGGLNVQVLPGAALDGGGSSLVLDEPRLLAIDPGDKKLPALVFVALGTTGAGKAVQVRAMPTKPDNRTWLELARIDLPPDVTEIRDPDDPDNPKAGEINRRHVVWAGSVGVAEKGLSAETLQRLVQAMRRTRRDFAALHARFPVPSAGDVRHAALTVETLARTDCLSHGRLPPLMAVLVAIEADVGQEIGTRYTNLVDPLPEFHAYRAAVRDLQAVLPLGDEPGILNAQDAVAEAARELSEIVVESPIADAGGDQTVATYEAQATVTLDGGASQARGGRELVRYLWLRKA